MRPDGTGLPLGSDVIVIGGGFHGTSSALHLSRRGAKVTLLEAEYCARHASGVNAGGVRSLGRHYAEVPLARASLGLWHSLPELIGKDLGDDAAFVASGMLQIAETPQELDKLRRRVAELNALGFTHEVIVDAQQVREIAPRLAHHVVGGIWVKDDGHAVPYRAVTAFRHAAQRLGAQFHEATPAETIERVGSQWHVTTPRGVFTAPWLVNAAGAWSGDFAAQAGDVVPMKPGGLMLMITQRVPHFVDPVLSAAGRPLSFKQFANGTVLIGGGLRCAADVVRRHGEIDFLKLSSSAQTVTDLFPHLAGINVVRAWAGVEAFMPDEIPVISLSRHAPQLVHAFGFSAHGFELGPIGGQIVSELVFDGRSTLPIAPFAVDRFAPAAVH
ncbi:NAD(P)/FAD-dependent oxidoreductase [Polaromonas sp. JS666]|uniref:NAD(P)/FAD-dependent oxidoreductase n=1 Tax=Polaromonas sp. (strain JS666 / ATCC BAA-500) TaxID=296591 RepID=UPI0000464883|nr:FAD-dependent oxidoreductase [Polaromonas sp. JS666]ABE46262.1 FAD dependent oxidoreductase [Polaromonas sp. JS666]UUZ73197.1 FAD-binding oxidoreductase [Polaromonas sp. P1(28)-8]